MDWKKAGRVMMVVDVVLVNLLVGYLIYKSEILNPKLQINPNSQNSNTYTFLEIDNKLAKLKEEIVAEVVPAGQSGIPVPSINPEPTIQARQALQASQAIQIKTRSVSYVTVPGSGRSTSLNWMDLAGTEFYFDKADYPGLMEVYFEANISLLNGNGRAYVRLYDVSHGIGVQGAETETSSQTAAIVTSGQLNFWSGKNLYRVQARTLTADTAIYNYGRLKIVTKN